MMSHTATASVCDVCGGPCREPFKVPAVGPFVAEVTVTDPEPEVEVVESVQQGRRRRGDVGRARKLAEDRARRLAEDRACHLEEDR